jgi:hypothetical protein
VKLNIGTAGRRVRDGAKGVRLHVVTRLQCWRLLLSAVQDCMGVIALHGRTTTLGVRAGMSRVSGIRCPRSRTGAAGFAAIRH